MTSVTPVVMVGGLGMRLWPLSRRTRPKQFHALTGAGSMLQETLRRVSPDAAGPVTFAPPVIIAGRAHADLVRADMEAASVAGGRLVLEPIGRSTGACAVVSAALIGADDPQALILLLPSDHHIADPEGFRAAVARAADTARAGRLVTFGIPATRPETGYGYILAAGDGEVREVERFVEKPDARTAAAYVADGRYFWNAGVFLMRADRLIEEMGRHAPAILETATRALKEARVEPEGLLLDESALGACPGESLDRAVMERTSLASVAPMNVGWSDVGAFDALHEAAERDEADNVVEADAVMVDATGCYVRSDGPLVAVVGLDDVVVVVDQGVVLVTSRSRAQDVKQVVERLGAQGRDELL